MKSFRRSARAAWGKFIAPTDTRLGRDVALKVLAQHPSDDPALKARFEREGRAISSLNDAHICHLYDIGSQNGTDYPEASSATQRRPSAWVYNGNPPATLHNICVGMPSAAQCSTTLLLITGTPMANPAQAQQDIKLKDWKEVLSCKPQIFVSKLLD